MRSIRWGKTGVEVPAICIGTWPFSGPEVADGESVGWSGHDDRLAKAALSRAFERGMTHWDTADVYGRGHAESLIGQMWADVARDRIFLASKVGWDKGGYAHYFHPDMMRKMLERTLTKAKTDVIDLYYLHHCDFGEQGVYFEPAMEAILRFKEEGKIRFIGLSDWDLDAIMKYVDRVQPDVIQPYRNVQDDAWVKSGLSAWVEANDVGVAFFSPIKHGLLLGKYDSPTEFPEGDWRRNVPEFMDAAVLEKMRHNRGLLEARFERQTQPVLHGLIGAILQDAPTACALMGMRNPNQVDAAAEAAEAQLSSEDAAWVRALYTN